MSCSSRGSQKYFYGRIHHSTGREEFNGSSKTILYYFDDPEVLVEAVIKKPKTEALNLCKIYVLFSHCESVDLSGKKRVKTMRSKTIVLQQEAKIFFYRNTTSPAAHFLSTIAHKQCQILLLSPQAQIKENITMSSEANISKVLFENPCIMWAGIYSNPI